MISTPRVLLLLSFLVASEVVAAAPLGVARVPVDGVGVVVLERPSAWASSVAGPSFGPTLTLEGREGEDFVLMITFIPRRRPRAAEEPDLESRVRAQGRDLLPTAIQTELEVVRVSGNEAQGYLYHLTDKKPESGPGDYRELHQGALELGTILLSVSILTHPGDEEIVASAIGVLRSARIEPPGR